MLSKRFVYENVAVNILENKNTQLSVSLDKTAIGIIDVSATSFHSSNIESALPITVPHCESLRMREENTLGDTLLACIPRWP